MIGDRIPGSGTTVIPVYRCETCRDSGLVPYKALVRLENDFRTAIEYRTKPCPDCDGRSRLCGEVDGPEEAKS